MKKAMLAIIALALIAMSNLAHARTQVTVCTSYLVGPTAEITCSGGFNGKTTILDLYRAGWRYAGDISGASHKFILIFEK